MLDIGAARRPLRILISSNGPHSGTGYGAQTALMAPRLEALGHSVGIFAWYGVQGAPLNYGFSYRGQAHNVILYPQGRDGYGNDLVGAHADQHRADIVLTLIDAWVLDPAAHGGARRWTPYFPIDSEPIPPAVLDKVRHALRPIVYSRFGERMAHDAGLDVAYVPHSVDTALFSPGEKAEARRRLGVPADAYLVAMVAANKDNPSRKSWPQALHAFKEFSRRHPDARLYLHTQMRGGTDLAALVDALELHDRIHVANQYAVAAGGYGDDHMVSIYRAADVLLSPSMGEGFGVPILEAQACGTPAIVGGWTAMPEICFGGHVIDKADAEPWYTPMGAYWWLPRVGAIVEGLEWAYTHGERHREAARAGALAYDADLVARDYWRPVLDDIGARMGVAEVAEEVAL